MKKFLVHFIGLIYFLCYVECDTINSLERKYSNEIDTIDRRISEAYDNHLCDFHFNKTLEGLNKRELWALEVLDSWGKIPSGILLGNFEIGNFDECLDFTHSFQENGSIMKGQYCLASTPMNLSSIGLKSFENPMFKMVVNTQRMNSFRFGICIPNTCRPSYFEKKLTSYLEDSGYLPIDNITIHISEKSCATNDPIKLRTVDKGAILTYSILGGIILVCTIYDYVMDLIKGEKSEILTSFSLLTNGKKIFELITKSLSSNSIECLNGIRVLSLIWVIYGHSHLIVFASTNNFKYVFEWLKTPYSMLIQSATLSVDSFFFLSGLLVAWIGLRDLEKRHWMKSVPLMYLRRYLRLTPVIGFTILFNESIIQYFGSGPFWNEAVQNLLPSCKKSWWSAILYVQNYVNPDKMCLPHTWYLAVDTQLYFISPFLLIPLWKWGLKFIWVPILLALGSISASFAIVYINNFPLLLIDDFVGSQDRMEKTYYVTHTRLSPWIVGLLFGYYLHLNRGKSLKLPSYAVILGWLGSLVVIAAAIFGYYERLPPNTRATRIEGAFYESLSRVSWSIALGWVVLACYKGYGGPINGFLSLSIWQPLSRLSYCMYIYHYFVEVIMFGNLKSNFHFSIFDMISHFYSLFGITLIVSIVTVLVFESPIISLEKYVLGMLDRSESKIENSASKEELTKAGNSVSEEELTKAEKNALDEQQTEDVKDIDVKII